MADKFQPSPSDLPDLSEYDELTEFDWDDVRSLAEEQGWTWDGDLGLYVDDDGEAVGLDVVLELTYEELDRIKNEVDQLTEELEESEDVETWERKLAELAAAAAALFFLLGIGTRDAVTDEHEELVSDRLKAQYEFLRQFSNDILDGNLTIDGIRARANLYPQDDQLLYSEAQELAHDAEVFGYYRNVLGGCDHCTECPDESAKGIVERGQLTPIGSRLCLWNCCCMFEYFKTQSGDTNSYRLTSQCLGWAGETKLTLSVTTPVT